MSEDPKPTPVDEELSPEELAEAEREEAAMSALLKRSLASPEAAPAPAAAAPQAPTEAERALLLAVQKKLRQRSKGKFYADGWSTTQTRISYALVAIVMLVTIAVVYLAMGPTGIH